MIILNYSITRHSGQGSRAISDAELNRLMELAYLYEEMRQSFDLYAYRAATARIKRRSIVFKHSDQEADTAAAVGAERVNDHDQTRQFLLANFEVELREALSSAPRDQSFVDFVNGNVELASRVRQFIRAKSSDYEFEVSEYFELESRVTTKSGSFSIKELIRGWAFLTFLAVAGQEWNRQKTELQFKADPIVDLPRGYATRILSRELGVDHRHAREILQQFTTTAGLGRVDLFYKPLVQLEPRRLVIPTPFVLGSRFDRNIFAIVVAESELDQKKKGFLPIRVLCESFRTAGFLSLTDFKVRALARGLLTDIDLVAFKDGILFLGQAKIVIEPDSMYDRWKAEEKMRHAAVQLRLCAEHLGDIQEKLLQRLGARGKVGKVVPFIVTNTRQFTERRFDGFPVVDVPYLSFILAGATGSVVQLQSGRPRVEFLEVFYRGRLPNRRGT